MEFLFGWQDLNLTYTNLRTYQWQPDCSGEHAPKDKGGIITPCWHDNVLGPVILALNVHRSWSNDIHNACASGVVWALAKAHTHIYLAWISHFSFARLASRAAKDPSNVLLLCSLLWRSQTRHPERWRLGQWCSPTLSAAKKQPRKQRRVCLSLQAALAQAFFASWPLSFQTRGAHSPNELPWSPRTCSHKRPMQTFSGCN